MLTESIVARWTDVAAGWLLTYLVHSTLILLAAWAATSWSRVSDATRDILWKAALVGGLVTATAQSAVAREPLGGQLRLAPHMADRFPAPMRIMLRDARAGVGPRVLVTRPNGTWWSAGLVAFWLTGAGVGLLFLTLGHARMVRALGERGPLEGTPIARRMRMLLARANIRRRVELTASATIASPVALACGEVCLPRRALLELEALEQDSMLAHEIAHLVRRDPHWLIAARAIETVLFLQPLNRLARHRVREVAEFLCDDWAVQRTSQPVTLAKCLASVAEWVGRSPPLHPVSAMVESGGSPLVRRVGRILGDGAVRQARSSRGAIGASVCAVVALAAVAPRISVAGSAISDRMVTLMRAVVEHEAASGRVERDTMVVFSNVRYRRVSIDSRVPKPIGTATIWMRPLPPRVRSAGVMGEADTKVMFVERHAPR